jgi:ATP phosphoribosyltransferase regulatory subunit
LLLEEWARWGYREVEVPFLAPWEVYAPYWKGKEEVVVRFLDPGGGIQALRPDLTPLVAHLVREGWGKGERPLRLSYAGPVFRRASGWIEEQRQAGLELLGAEGQEAELEVILCAAAGLQAAGVEDFRLALGLPSLVEKVLAERGFGESESRRALGWLARRNYAALEEMLKRIPGGEEIHRWLLFGGEEMPLAAGSKEASSLLELADRLSQAGLGERVVLDWGLVREIGYYRGMVFEITVAGSGQPLGGGGRYVLSANGREEPAVGFALRLEPLLREAARR